MQSDIMATIRTLTSDSITATQQTGEPLRDQVLYHRPSGFALMRVVGWIENHGADPQHST